MVEMIGSTISGNAAGIRGGAIFARTDASISLVNATLSGNRAVAGGGAIYGAADNAVTLLNATVTGNRADGSGGGISLLEAAGQAVLTLTNSIVAGNDAAGAADDLLGIGGADLNFTGGNIVGSAPVAFNVTGDVHADRRREPGRTRDGVRRRRRRSEY